MAQTARYFLKSCRETALVLLGAPLIIATIFAWMLYLMRNSNEIWGFFGDYESELSGGQIVIWNSDRSHHWKLDKPDLILLVAATSLCLLAWMVYMRWRSAWRRRRKYPFPIQLLAKAVEPIAAVSADGPGAIGANAGVVLAASPPVRRSKRIMLWLCLLSAAGVYLLIFWSHIHEADSPETATLILDGEESKYLAKEGHQRRGKAFEAVASRMDVANFPKKQFTWPQVQNYLGPPDWYEGPLNQPNAVVYFYDRYAKKDAAVFVFLDSHGRTSFGWSMAAVIGPAGWSTYPTTLPATMPATTKP